MFEWDPAKAEANLLKHGVSFDEAATVFLDADALDGSDELIHVPNHVFGGWGNRSTVVC